MEDAESTEDTVGTGGTPNPPWDLCPAPGKLSRLEAEIAPSSSIEGCNVAAAGFEKAGKLDNADVVVVSAVLIDADASVDIV